MNIIEYKEILKKLPQLYYIIDTESYVIVDSNNEQVNKGEDFCYKKIFGYHAPCDSFNNISCACLHIKQSGQKFETIQNFDIKNEKKTFKVTANPIKYSNKEAKQIIIQYIDVTKEFELQEKLQKQNFQLQSQNEEYEVINEELKEQKEEFEALYEELKEANRNIEKAKSELSGLKDFFENINESIQDGIWVSDKNDVIFYTNPGMEKIAGVSRMEIINKNVLKDFPKETTKELLPYFHKAKETLQPVWYQIKLTTPASRSSIQNGWLNPMVKRGAYNGMICTIRDVTESVQSQELVALSEEKFRLLFENMLEAFALHEIITDESNNPIDYRFIDVNPGFEKLTGLKRKEILNKTVLEVLPNTEKEWIEKYGKVALHGKAVQFEQYAQELNKHFKVIAYSPKIGYFATIFEDITAIKQAETELKESMDKFNHFIDESIDALSLVNSKGDIIIWNKAQEKLTGYTFKEIKNKKIWELHWDLTTDEFKKTISKKETELRLKNITNKLPEGWNRRIEIPIKRKNGEIRYIEQVLFPIKTEKEILLGGINRDITEMREANLKIIQSEEKHRALYQNAPLAYQSLNIDGNILDVNPQWLKVLGYKREEVIGKWFGSFLSAESVDHFKKNFPAFKRKGTVSNVQFKMKKKNGDTIYVSFEGCIGYTPEGNFKQTYCTFKDITEQVLVEKYLKESEEKYRRLTENSPEITYIYSLKGGALYWSSKVKDILGIDPNDLQKGSRKWTESILPKYRKEIDELFKNIKPGTTYVLEYEIYDTKGSIHWFNDHIFSVYEKDDDIILEGIVKDITEEKEAEQVVKQSEERFRSVLENMNLIGLMLNPKGEIIFANDFLLKITEWKKQEVIGENWFKKFLPDKVKEGVLEFFTQTMEKKQMPVSHTNEIITKSGDIRLIHWNNTLHFNENKEIISVTSIGEDITEQEQAKQLLKESEERYNLAMASANDGLFDWNLITNEIYYSPRWKSLLGYKDHEIKNVFSEWERLTNPDDVKQSWEKLKEHIAGKTDRFEMEFKMQHKDGHWVDILARANAYLDENGVAYRVVGTHVDISETVRIREKLEQNVKRYQKAQEIGKVGNWEFNIQTNTFWGSDEAKSIYGFSPKSEEFTAEYVESCIPERERVHQALIDLIESEKPYDLIFDINPINGSKSKTINSIAELEKDKDGNPLKVIGVIQDITEQKKIEEELRTKEILLRASVESPVDVIILSLDRDYNYLYFNETHKKAMKAAYGKIPNLGECIFDYMTNKDDIERIKTVYDKGLKGESNVSEDVYGDKQKSYFRVHINPIYDDNNEIIGITSYSHNITERRLSETQLKQSEEEYRSLFENAPIMIGVIDEEGIYQQVNDVVHKVLGYEIESIINTISFSYIHKDDLNKVLTAFSYLKTQGEGQVIYRFKHKNGGYKTISSKATKIPATDKYLIYSLDITERVKAEFDLKQNEEKYRNLFENIIDEVHLWKVQRNKDGKIKTWKLVDANPSALKSWNKIKQEIIGKTTNEIFDYDATKQFMPIVEKIFKTGKPYHWETYFQPTNQYLSMSSVPYDDFFISTGRDISEQKEAEIALKESESKFRSYLNNAPYGIFVTNEKGKYIEVNPKACKITGYSEKELLSLQIPDIIAKTDLENAEKHFETCVKNGFSTGELAFVTKNGEKRFWRVDAVKLSETRILGFVTDTTEAQLARNALLESEEKFKTLTESSPLAVMLFQDNRWIYVNPKAIEITEYSENELQKMNFWDFVHPDYVDMVKQRGNARQSGNNAPYNYNFKIVSKSGIEKWVSLYGASTTYAGKSAAILSVLDITELKTFELALQDSEKKLRNITENSTNLFYQHDVEGKLSYVSPQVKNILGYSVDEAMVKWTEFVTDNPINSEGVKHTEKAIKTGEVQPTYELELKHKSGKKVWVEVREAPLVEKGETIAIVGALSDITEQKKAAIALKESEELYRKLFESANVGIGISTIGGDILAANQAMTNIFEYSNKELLSISIRDLYKDLKDRETLLDTVEKEGEIKNFQIQMKPKIGEDLWVHISAQKISLIEDDRLLFVISDITKEKKAELEIQEQEAKFRAYIESSPIAIFIVDSEGNYTYANKAVTKMLGYSRDEILKMSVPDIKVVENIYHIYSDFEELKEKEILSSREVVYRAKNKQNISVMLDAVKLSNNEYIAFCTDISQLKSYEKELKEKNEEYLALNEEMQEYIEKLQKLNIDLHQAKQKAEESDRLKSAFLANMSHELRTPLNGILGFSTLMQKTNLHKEAMLRYSQIIETSGKRLLTVVNDLFDISLLHSDQLKVEKDSFRINELLDEINTFYHTINSKKIKTVSLNLIKSSDAEITITNDKYRLHQIFKNLLDNAFKFTSEGEITFGYNLETKNKITFFVKDTGIGIEKKYQEMIFSSFKQVDDSITRDYEGAGLGLAICSGLLERMGGSIWVESEKDKGSEFYFELPLKKDEAAGDVNQQIFQKKNLLKDKIILIVEDDLVSYEFLKIYLENIGGSGIIQTANGEEAVKIVTSAKIDLIFMDIRLPGIDGYETTKRIRKVNKDVKIIAQTAYALENDDQKSIAAGCNHHISKPINENELLDIIEKYFG